MTLYLVVVSADKPYKKFGHKSGTTFKSGSKLFETKVVFLIEFLKLLILIKKYLQTTTIMIYKKHTKTY